MFGAGYGSRTRLASLEGWNTTVMPTPHNLVRKVGVEPTMSANFKSARYASSLLARNWYPRQVTLLCLSVISRVLYFCATRAMYLVLPVGFEPTSCGNLPPKPAYKTGVLPLNYGSMVGLQSLEL
jgi:hypothetical protein